MSTISGDRDPVLGAQGGHFLSQTPFFLLDQLAPALETNSSLWREQDLPGAARKEVLWCQSYL